MLKHNTRHYVILVPERDYIEIQEKHLKGIAKDIGGIGRGFFPIHHYDDEVECLYISIEFFGKPITEKPLYRLVKKFEQRLDKTGLKWERRDIPELLRKVGIPKD